MPRFQASVHGRGLWISINDVWQRAEFRVERIVDATNEQLAREKALELVAGDPRVRPRPGYPAPVLVADRMEQSSATLCPQPGFAFYPDPA